MRLDISQWHFPDRVELKNSLYPNYSPKYHTGMFINTWGGWEWRTAEGLWYRTDTLGDGLWMWSSGEENWVQISGTCQFGLPQNRKAAIRKLQRLGYEIRRLE